MQRKIDDLPDELLEYILSLIPPYKDLQGCKLVSKRWCRATKNVIEHNKAHFHKSVAYGTLYWNPWPCTQRMPVIGKRHSHSACTYENSMYVFGGCTAACTTFNDLWRLDLDTRTWVRLITMGSYPSPKACATMLYHEKKFILFGGSSHPSPYPVHQQWKLYNELHVYYIEANKWSVVNTLKVPPPISAHSATIHGDLMVVFGGVYNDYSSSNDVWCLNLNTYCWYKQSTSNIKPQPRYGQSQIELGEKYLLILGGCTGPNIPMNDTWLLEMTGPIWTWKKINMLHAECAPTRIWCHQARRVGNYIIVLSKRKRQAKPNDASANVKHSPSEEALRVVETNRSYDRQGSTSSVDTEENVNGRHGLLPRSIPRNAQNLSNPSSVHLPLYNENMLSMAAFRDEPVHSNSNTNRQRLLELLRRLEMRIQNRRTQSKVKKTENTLSIFVLDIANVLCEESSASWIPLKYNSQSGPNERILYSLVVGKGELIVFGGIRKEQLHVDLPDMDEPEVYNDLHFINPPRYII